MTSSTLSLVVRRTIAASPSRLFDAWTTPALLQSWWGPRGVRCTHAEIDARAGGRYRIANQLADGTVLWIAGEFLVVEPPHKLVFTWAVEPGAAGEREDAGEHASAHADAEQVTVRFEPRGSATEVIVLHERIASQPTRDRHAEGWRDCLDGLAGAV